MPRAVPIRADISAPELRRRAKSETDGRAWRRMLALAAVIEGASRGDAARLAGMDRVHRFNVAGIDGLRDRPHIGRPSRLNEARWRAFRQSSCAVRMARRTGSARGRRIAEAAAAHPQAERIELWLQDEARIGQTGRNCRRWFQQGTRPTGIEDQRPMTWTAGPSTCSAPSARSATPPSAWSCRSSGRPPCRPSSTSSAARWPRACTRCSSWTEPAGTAPTAWSPDNITQAFLPPYPPELIAIERRWLHLKERILCHRLWPN
jgi:hypothetical protein